MIPQDKVLYKYQWSVSKYRRGMTAFQIIVLLLFGTITISTMAIKLFEGQKRKLKTLLFHPECTGQCYALLNSFWFPFQAALPLDSIKVGNLTSYKLQTKSNYVYYLCNNLRVDETKGYRVDYRPTDPVLDVQQQTFLMSPTWFQSSGDLYEVEVEVQLPGAVVINGEYQEPKNGIVPIAIPEHQIAEISLYNLVDIDSITYFQYSSEGCTVYQDSKQLNNYKHLIAIQIPEDDVLSLDLTTFDFIGSVVYTDGGDIALIALFVIGLLASCEAIVYFCYSGRRKYTEKKRVEAIKEYLDDRLQDESQQAHETSYQSLTQ